MGRKRRAILSDVLETIPSDRIVCIGSEKDPAWAIIDSASYITEHWDVYEQLQKRYIETSIEGSQNKLNIYPNRIVAIQRKIKLAGESEVEELNKRLALSEEIYHKAYQNRKRLSRALEKWVPIKDRRVLDISPSNITGNILIHVDGYLKGVKWFDGDASQNLHAPL